MIFYFSGTGNSLYVAQKLHEDEGGELINMADAINEKCFKYKVTGDEKIGFVFPVYFYGLPTIVSEFTGRLAIESDSKHFIYSVITYAGSIGNADKMLEKLLKKVNLHLNSSLSIIMPNNYNIMSDLPDKEKQNKVLQNAEKEIEKVGKLLRANKKGNFAHHGYFPVFTPIAYSLYGIFRKTKKFYATDACTSCGLCEEICPSKTIQLTSGKPEWINEKCSHCTACINRCPAQAIQYGNSTKKRERYVNPNVEFSDM